MLEPFFVDTLVVLACPFTKLVDEAMDGSKTVMLKEIDAATLKMQLSNRGQLAITSYENLAQHRTKLSSIKSKGVNIVIVFDEVQNSNIIPLYDFCLTRFFLTRYILCSTNSENLLLTYGHSSQGCNQDSSLG